MSLVAKKCLLTPASLLAILLLLVLSIPIGCQKSDDKQAAVPEAKEAEKTPETMATPQVDRITLVYHGLDFSRFPAAGCDDADLAASPRDGSDPARPVIVLSVGRAVAKKGYDDLLDALAALPAGQHWRFVHVGGGPLLPALRRQADRLGLSPRIEWRGAQPQEAVLAAYREADIFVLASRIAADGDRDGLPNVLMEAQSQGVVCLATATPGIRELIEDGITGVLVPPGAPAELGGALARLIGAAQYRADLAIAGERRVRQEFGMAAGIARLAAMLTGG
jgi:glycosyltransferase involved in cell wall biosynthesis